MSDQKQLPGRPVQRDNRPWLNEPNRNGFWWVTWEDQGRKHLDLLFIEPSGQVRDIESNVFLDFLDYCVSLRPNVAGDENAGVPVYWHPAQQPIMREAMTPRGKVTKVTYARKTIIPGKMEAVTVDLNQLPSQPGGQGWWWSIYAIDDLLDVKNEEIEALKVENDIIYDFFDNKFAAGNYPGPDGNVRHYTALQLAMQNMPDARWVQLFPPPPPKYY